MNRNAVQGRFKAPHADLKRGRTGGRQVQPTALDGDWLVAADVYRRENRRKIADRTTRTHTDVTTQRVESHFARVGRRHVHSRHRCGLSCPHHAHVLFRQRSDRQFAIHDQRKWQRTGELTWPNSLRPQLFFRVVAQRNRLFLNRGRIAAAGKAESVAAKRFAKRGEARKRDVTRLARRLVAARKGGDRVGRRRGCEHGEQKQTAEKMAKDRTAHGQLLRTAQNATGAGRRRDVAPTNRGTTRRAWPANQVERRCGVRPAHGPREVTALGLLERMQRTQPTVLNQERVKSQEQLVVDIRRTGGMQPPGCDARAGACLDAQGGPADTEREKVGVDAYFGIGEHSRRTVGLVAAGAARIMQFGGLRRRFVVVVVTAAMLRLRLGRHRRGFRFGSAVAMAACTVLMVGEGLKRKKQENQRRDDLDCSRLCSRTTRHPSSLPIATAELRRKWQSHNPRHSEPERTQQAYTCDKLSQGKFVIAQSRTVRGK